MHYSMQHYENKFVNELPSVVFSGTPVSSHNKTDCNDIAEILLKVVLNTITLTIIFTFLALCIHVNDECRGGTSLMGQNLPFS